MRSRRTGCRNGSAHSPEANPRFVRRHFFTGLIRLAQTGIEARKLEVQQVREIVADEVERFGQYLIARQAAPLIAELHERAENLRQAEIDRFSSRLSALSLEQREHVEVLTKAIVAKLLHSPSTQLKNSAGTPQGERISAALRDLFDIE